jgi:hypothetical protein
MIKEIRSADSIAGSTLIQLKIKYGASLITYDYANNKIRRKKDASTAYLTDVGQVKSLSFSYPKPGLAIINLDQEKTGAFCRNE